jgi:hypothetical protein
MSVQRRALLIASLGPLMQAVGLAWEALHVAIAHWNVPMSARHLIYEPGVLLIIVGFFVMLVGTPLAIEVARATEAELVIPVYEPEPSDEAQRSPSQRLRRGGLSH